MSQNARKIQYMIWDKIEKKVKARISKTIEKFLSDKKNLLKEMRAELKKDKKSMQDAEIAYDEGYIGSLEYTISGLQKLLKMK